MCGGKDSISFVFHCAINVAWPLWPPVAKICSIPRREIAEVAFDMP